MSLPRCVVFLILFGNELSNLVASFGSSLIHLWAFLITLPVSQSVQVVEQNSPCSCFDVTGALFGDGVKFAWDLGTV